MKSNAEIKQHAGLDVVRYSEIAGTKGLAGERDVGHTRLIVKPASQPALKPSWNPLGWRGSCASRGGVEGRMGCGGHIWSWSRLCDFYKKASVKNQWSISFQITPTQMLWHSHLFVELFGAFPRLRTLTCGSLRGQSSRLAAYKDYTIKLLVNPVVRNRSKCHERLLEGCMLRISWYSVL